MADDSSDEESPPPKPKKKRSGPRPRNEGLDISNILPRSTRHKDDRRPSKKADTTNKENSDAAALKIAALEKSLKNARAKAKQAEKNAPAVLNDNELESEEKSDDDAGINFTSSGSIVPLGRLPVPSPRPLKGSLRKTTRSDITAKKSPRMFIKLAESNRTQLSDDDQYDDLAQLQPPLRDTPMDVDPRDTDDDEEEEDDGPVEIDDEDPPPRQPRAPAATPAPARTRAPGSAAPAKKAARPGVPSSSSTPTGDKGRQRGRQQPGATPADKRPRSGSASPPPPAKRVKGPKGKISELREGFVAAPGIKPKAADYQDVPQALLLRAIADYCSRIIAIYAFPPVNTQTQWAADCWTVACRAAKERYLLSDRMAKLITKRGSQIRGKILEKYRSLFAAHYGFVRSSTAAAIQANIALAAKLLAKAAFHYKDVDARTGFGGNIIIASARQLTTFKDKHSLGAIFRSRFSPITLNNLALDFTVLEFLTREWKTGTHIPAQFFEKDVTKYYEIHVQDVEDWSKLNPSFCENVRLKWTRRACETLGLTDATSTTFTNIDKTQEALMRDEMAGRTGETDSEAEDELENEPEAGTEEPTVEEPTVDERAPVPTAAQ
ncbi:hypothetical protein C8J57DRAFT_1494938 [Mycena rebaudengoi]|nr:hypothetical protein C8J57DRAFT_1494938 [Mycena rebaudengoi]